MWYIAAPAARDSASAMSATVDCASTERAARAASANTPVGAPPDRSVEELDQLEDGDVAGRAGERVAALHAALGSQHAGPAQGGEQLLEELDGDARRRASSAIGTGPRSPWWRSSTSALSAYGDFVVIEIIAAADHRRNGELWLRNASASRRAWRSD